MLQNLLYFMYRKSSSYNQKQHYYKSGGGSRFYRYFDDVTLIYGIPSIMENPVLWMAIEKIFEMNLLMSHFILNINKIGRLQTFQKYLLRKRYTFSEYNELAEKNFIVNTLEIYKTMYLFHFKTLTYTNVRNIKIIKCSKEICFKSKSDF